MKCSSCGYTGPETDFTKGNRSHGGHKGRCKKCKSKLDKAYKAKTDIMPKYFEPKADLLIRKKCDIGVLRLIEVRKTKRAYSNFGMDAILSELKESWELCHPETMNNYKIVLISLTSVMDVENLIYTFEKYGPETVTAKIIIGGFGVININMIVDYIDIAVFGRAEGQINEIINGFTFSNVWRKVYDPMVEREYKIRQPQYLLKGEVSVGCRGRCSYCQYGHIRKSLGRAEKYHPGKSISTPETDWNGLVVDKAGKYITAWDGWSEDTRRRVNKPISDKDIISKLVDIGNDPTIDGTVSLKTYQIVGYPWETAESVLNDIEHTGRMLSDIDKKIDGKIVLAFCVTPFGPEPLTPMANEPANITTDWRALLAGYRVYDGDNVRAFIITAISGPFTLLKRMWINRAGLGDIERFKSMVFDSRIKRIPERYKVGWLLDNGVVDISLFGAQEKGIDNICV
jgi:hypothetical protein